MPRVVAVIVTMARPRELDVLLRAIAQQERRPDEILVVENAPRSETAAVLSRHAGVRHLPSRANLGGAGGFAYGVLAALAEGATHVWMMDDDGVPEEPDCLRRLIDGAERHRADLIAPVIVDIEDPSRLSFPYYVGSHRVLRRQELAGARPIEGFAHLFNGALVRAEAFSRFGLPDMRLFLRGDEVDFLHRVRRGGGLVMTLPDVGFRHPSGLREAVPLLGGRLHAVVPGDARKEFHFFRNRGYLLRRHRLVKQALHDVLRYGLYYLSHRRGDWRGYARWAGLMWRGIWEDFRPWRAPEAPPPRRPGRGALPGVVLPEAGPSARHQRDA